MLKTKPKMVLALVVFLLEAMDLALSTNVPTRNFELRVPSARPTVSDTYVCTAMKVDPDQTYYLVGYEPLAEAKIAHHMLLYGCKSPGSTEPLFNCGTMTAKQKGLPWSMQPCGSGSQVVYAWAGDAPQLDLPEDVGYKVGGDSGVEWLVLQVHYATTRFIDSEKGDDSGISIRYTNVPMPRLAGVWYSMSSGRMPAETETKVEAACTVKTSRELHPFAFRVHTHQLGTAVSGWRVTGSAPDHQWSLLGIQDPQLPQAFYPVANSSAVIRNNDVIATRCTMDNWKTEAVWMGSTREAEMCNFYLMYWVDASGNEVDDTAKQCKSLGPPIYYWSRSAWLLGGGLSNVPDTKASELQNDNNL